MICDTSAFYASIMHLYHISWLNCYSENMNLSDFACENDRVVVYLTCCNCIFDSTIFEKTKKWFEKMNYQNILAITYKNRAGKPWYRRSSRGDRRNGISSIKSIDTLIKLVETLNIPW